MRFYRLVATVRLSFFSKSHPHQSRGKTGREKEEKEVNRPLCGKTGIDFGIPLTGGRTPSLFFPSPSIQGEK